ncbi:PREDICTED: keratin, type I cytoskeletal 19-like [Nanorana parkeri]|uniref:keratin, type I cytoskeletal 19-like n=1 Tax=Nanorana parkeri TaxID=125878 RepID=UPI0008543529|nr:PREDICTED: keratin, type I cytoskeletal 19-like [Nanorana parkeri]
MSHSNIHSSSRSLIDLGHCGGHKGSSHISSHHHGGLPAVHHKSSISHHGGHYKSPSVHGKVTRVSFSTHSSSGHGHGLRSGHGGHGHGSNISVAGGHHQWKNAGFLSINGKETMQHLNQRLSTYLEKVHSLEQENAQLERKITEWYANNAPSSLPDSSHYFRTIQELQNQVSTANVDSARIILQIDNAQLAADDLKSKYEMELNLRNNVEADVASLRKALEDINMQRQDLEIQLRCLQEELLQLKKNHEEEANSLRAQLGARVNVELDAAPSVDLNQTLSEVRDQYENLMERNLKEVESIFLARIEELNSEMSSGDEQLQTVSNELIDLKRTAQTLEIELQSQLSMKSALESTLAETEGTFGSQLDQLQTLIDNVESQLGQIRSDLERQNHDYKILMDQKTHLEMEIATYKHLLDGHDIQYVKTSL